MVFSSLLFLYLFLPLCLLCSALCPKIWGKNIVLIVFSLVFYAWGEPVYVLLLLASAFVNYFCGLLMGEKTSHVTPAFRRNILILAVVLDLGALAFFKYAGFFVENLRALTRLPLPVPQLALPIGISFYTFQALSYVIDVYRGEVHVQRRYDNFLMYLALFPQLIAGPIVRYSEIEPQITERKITGEDLLTGLNRFFIGLGKKVLIANYCGSVASELLDGKTGTLTTLAAWLGMILYSMQIYFDFSGYSDMAIGMGRMFGFHYAENFNLPYISKSITEFWRRWHISLSGFFRDYVYIPLGGNRKHQILNLLAVWSLTGLWHGASWNFVLWGLYFFVLLVVEKRFQKQLEKVPAVLRHIVTLLLIVFGWTLFYFTDLHDIGNTLCAMFGAGAGLASADVKLRLIAALPLLVLGVLGCTGLPRKAGKTALALLGAIAGKRGKKWSLPAYVVTFVFDLLILLLSTASLVGSSYNAFLYFRF